MSVLFAKSGAMQEVRFRCREDSAEFGTPERAKPCRCGRQVIDRNDGLCVLCGREPAEAISHQWDQQSWLNRKQARRSTPRPFREHKNGHTYRIRFDAERAA